MIEAKKLAYADMIRYNADPHFAKIPALTASKSKDFAKQRAALINASKANWATSMPARRRRPTMARRT